MAATKSDPSEITQVVQNCSRTARQLLYQELLQPWHQADLPEHEEKDQFVQSFTEELEKAEGNYHTLDNVRVDPYDVFEDCKDHGERTVSYGFAFAQYLKLPAFGWSEGKKVFVLCFPMMINLVLTSFE